MDEQKLNELKKNNIKIYKFYRVFSWDLLFYYAIFYLFLIMVKGITPAQVLQFDAFYILFKFIVQIPCTLMIQKFGKRNSLVIANAIGIIHILVIIFALDFGMLIFSQFLCAITFVVRSTCESDMLYDSLDHDEERGHRFAKIDGKANSRYYYIDAISAVLSGFLYVINPYIPMILCAVTLFITFVLSTRFEEIHTSHKTKERMHIREELRTLRYGFKNIFTSKRLVCLVIFNAIVVGLIRIMTNIRNTVLIEIGMPEQYFGIIFAMLSIITGLYARGQGIIHKHHRNKTLTFLAIPMAISCLLMGIIILCGFSQLVTTLIILLLIVIATCTKGPYYVLIKRYLNNFTNSEKRIRIATVNNLLENAISSSLLFASSFILEYINITYTTIIIGSIFTIVLILLLDFMRDKVGLQPEEYTKNEIL